MLFLDGIGFKDKASYDAACEDKRIIDDIKSRCNLNTEQGISEAYSLLASQKFNSVLGDKFDDEVYELYEKVKKGTFKETVPSLNEKNSKAKKVKPNKSKTEDKEKKPKASKRIKELSKVDPKIDLEAKKKLKRANAFRTVIIVLLLLVSAGSLTYFVKYMKSAQNVEELSEAYSELIDTKYAKILPNVTQVIKKDYSPDVVIPDILDEYLALYNKNKSLIGWIKIADTNIDYPVMQGTDNEYYLKHNFNQEKDSNGCIFLDCNCDIVLGNDNFILYGHHMKNGKMFSSIIKYANNDFYEEHKKITFDTIYEKGTYEVMYAFRSRIYNSDEITFKYYQFIDANSEEEFNSAMEEMASLSLIDTGVTASYGDKLLTLSTCDYQEDKNGRFVVVAKKID